jgi:hypothetical protein
MLQNILDEHFQQNEDSGERSSRHISIHEESSRFYERFQLQGRQLHVSIIPPPPDANVFAWLETAIHELYKHVCEYAQPTDYIGMTVNSE